MPTRKPRRDPVCESPCPRASSGEIPCVNHHAHAQAPNYVHWFVGRYSFRWFKISFCVAIAILALVAAFFPACMFACSFAACTRVHNSTAHNPESEWIQESEWIHSDFKTLNVFLTSTCCKVLFSFGFRSHVICYRISLFLQKLNLVAGWQARFYDDLTRTAAVVYAPPPEGWAAAARAGRRCAAAEA